MVSAILAPALNADGQSRYNNRFIAKLMLMWKEKKEET